MFRQRKHFFAWSLSFLFFQPKCGPWWAGRGFIAFLGNGQTNMFLHPHSFGLFSYLSKEAAVKFVIFILKGLLKIGQYLSHNSNFSPFPSLSFSFSQGFWTRQGFRTQHLEMTLSFYKIRGGEGVVGVTVLNVTGIMVWSWPTKNHN